MLADLPLSVLHSLASVLDPASLRSICCCCRSLNSALFKSNWSSLTIDWKKTQHPPRLDWSQDAGTLKSVHLLAPKDMTQASEDKLGQFFKDVPKHSAAAARPVTSVHLKGWKMRQSNRHAPSMPSLLFKAFPALTTLRLDRCRDVHLLLAKKAPWQHLRDLEISYPTYGPHGASVELIIDNIGALTQLTRLAIIAPDRYEGTVDVVPLSGLMYLKRLELSLACMFLMGMETVCQCCPELEHLVFLHGNVGGGGSVAEMGDELYWPALKTAHVAVASSVLPQLGLMPATAPQLQSLHLTLTDMEDCFTSFATDSEDEDGDSDMLTPASALAKLSQQQPALQSTVVLSGAQGLCGAFHNLSLLSNRLTHLVLTDIGPNMLATPACIFSAMSDLKQLKQLTLAGVKMEDAGVWEQVLLQQKQLTRVVVGISGEHTGYDRWRPLSKEAQMWYNVLMNVLSASAPPTAGGGGGGGRGGKGRRTGRNHNRHKARSEPSGGPVDIYFGLWCPGSRVDAAGLLRVPAYLRLRKIAEDQVRQVAAAATAASAAAATVAAGTSGAGAAEPTSMGSPGDDGAAAGPSTASAAASSGAGPSSSSTSTSQFPPGTPEHPRMVVRNGQLVLDPPGLNAAPRQPGHTVNCHAPGHHGAGGRGGGRHRHGGGGGGSHSYGGAAAGPSHSHSSSGMAGGATSSSSSHGQHPAPMSALQWATTPALGRYRLRECPGSSAADLVFAPDTPWLQPQLTRLHQLLDEPCPTCLKYSYVYEILPGDYGMYAYDYSDELDHYEY